MTEQAETRSRVLLVEDEAMIAMLIEDMLVELGCDVVATAAKLDDAVSLAQSGSFDLAFLDLNLRGVASYPVAQALRERGIPFAFVTGYGTAGADPAVRRHACAAEAIPRGTSRGCCPAPARAATPAVSRQRPNPIEG